MSVLFSKQSETCICGVCWDNIGIGISQYTSKNPEGEVNPAKFDSVKRIFHRYNDLVDELEAKVRDIINEEMDGVKELFDNKDKYKEQFFYEEAAARTMMLGSWNSVLKNTGTDITEKGTKQMFAEGEELAEKALEGLPKSTEGYQTRPSMFELLKETLTRPGMNQESFPPGPFYNAAIPGDELPKEVKDMADPNGFIDLRGKVDGIPKSVMPLLGIALLGALAKGMVKKADEVNPESDGVPSGSFVGDTVSGDEMAERLYPHDPLKRGILKELIGQRVG